MLYFPPFRLDLVNGLLWRGEQLIHLHPKSQAVLLHLLENGGRTVSPEAIREAVWQKTIVSDSNLKVCIREIRKALGDEAKRPRFIETVVGVGYRFMATVQDREAHTQPRDEPIRNQGSSTDSQEFFSAPILQPHSPLPVGRDMELAQLYSCLHQALSGQRQIVFVSGEPGLGKTTLVRAFQDELSLTPYVWTALGRCIEHYGAGEAYLPLLDALTQLQTEQQRSVLVPLLQQYAPTWLAQLPSLISEKQRKLVSIAPTATRERMLREFAHLIETLTAQAPLAVILEDLHWSDPSTLELLVALAQRRGPARLLLIGTYRPEAIYVDNHPFRAIVQELHAHRLCTELALAPLTETELQAYLTTHFPQNTFPTELAHVLQARTEGNPLFLTNLLETFVSRGLFERRNGAWRLTQPLFTLAKETPESFRLLLERQIERLTREEQQMLTAASLVGHEFSAATVAAALGKEVITVEARCESLARRRQFLRAAGDSEWPNGERAARYAFLHALTREAWSERVPAAHRQRLHQRIGSCLEVAYRDHEEDIAVELAMHFEAGRDLQRAVRYHQLAGKKANKQLAYREASFHLSSALSLLHTYPLALENPVLELQLQLTLTHPLIALKGWAAQETQQAYQRAYELSGAVGGPAERFIALFGLWVVAYTRAELPTAHNLAQQLLVLARQHRDPTRRMRAAHALGNTLHRMGDLPLARSYLERGISLHERQRPHRQILRDGLDDGVAGLGYVAWVLWALGYPEQAQQKTDAMFALARELSHPLNVAWALNSAAWHSQFQHNAQVAQQYAEAEIALCEEHRFAQLHAVGFIVQGWTLASQGQPDEGIRLMEAGLAAVEQTGAAIGRPRYLTVLAEVYSATGQNQKALSLLSQAERCMAATGEYFYAAELHRWRGEITLRQANVPKGSRFSVQRSALQTNNTPHSAISTAQLAAEKCFHQAIAIACQQRAKSFELRAVMSLCRLWKVQGRRDAARQALGKIYNWFREGMTTPDLQAARALFEELDNRPAPAAPRKKAPAAS